MRSITVLRVEADSGVVGRVLGKLPVVEVVETQPVDESPPTPARANSPAEPPDIGSEDFETDAEDDGGLLAGVTPEGGIREPVPLETELGGEEEASPVKQYGLLGAGITFLLAGLASVGIWAYQRRGDGEAETPPPAESFAPTPAVGETPAPSPGTDDGEADSAAPVTESLADERAEPAGRVEGDRSDVEWTTRDREPTPDPVETRTEFDAGTSEFDIEDDADEASEDPGPSEPVDPAPLLGVAFIAVSGALVRWLRRGDDGE